METTTILSVVLIVSVISGVIGISTAYYVYKKFQKLQQQVGVGAGGEKHARRKRDYPMSYPKGWYKLMNAQELKPGDHKLIEALGTSFVVFRGIDSKKVGVLDAFCIHMGANIGVGGKVVGDCITCPFHLWEWNTEGKCEKIPYQPNVPDRCVQPSYPSMEYYGLILVWYDAKKAPPSYHPPPVPALDSGEFVYSGKYNGYIGMHLIEIAENSADFNHFDTLHGTMNIPYTQIKIPFIKIIHVASAEYGVSKAPHLLQFQDKAHIKIFGKEIPHTNAVADITFVGPSCVMIFQFNTEAGKIILFQTHTPTPDALNCRTEFLWYAEKKVWSILSWYVVGNWISQWGNDVFVWENKTFMRRPFLVKGDGPIMKLRRWMYQFYDMETIAFDTDDTQQQNKTKENSNASASTNDDSSLTKRKVPSCTTGTELEW